MGYFGEVKQLPWGKVMVGLWQGHSAHSIKAVLSKDQRDGGVGGIQSQKILLESSEETLLQSFLLLQGLKNWPST